MAIGHTLTIGFGVSGGLAGTIPQITMLGYSLPAQLTASDAAMTGLPFRTGHTHLTARSRHTRLPFRTGHTRTQERTP